MMSHSHYSPHIRGPVGRRAYFIPGPPEPPRYVRDNSSRGFTAMPTGALNLYNVGERMNPPVGVMPAVTPQTASGIHNVPGIIMKPELGGINSTSPMLDSNNPNNGYGQRKNHSRSSSPANVDDTRNSRANTSNGNAGNFKDAPLNGNGLRTRQQNKFNRRNGGGGQNSHKFKRGKHRRQGSASRPGGNNANLGGRFNRGPIRKDKYNQNVDIYNPVLLNDGRTEISRERVMEVYRRLELAAQAKAGSGATSDVGNKLLLLNTLLPSKPNSIQVTSPASGFSRALALEEMSEVSDESDAESLLEMEIVASAPRPEALKEAELLEGRIVNGSPLRGDRTTASDTGFTTSIGMGMNKEGPGYPSSISSLEAIEGKKVETQRYGLYSLFEGRPNAGIIPIDADAQPSMGSNSNEGELAISASMVQNKQANPFCDISISTSSNRINSTSDLMEIDPYTDSSTKPKLQDILTATATSPEISTPLHDSRSVSATTLRLRSSKKLVLVLDLDNTLLHAFARIKLNCNVDLEDFLDHAGNPELYKVTLGLMPDYEYYLKLRPYVREMLERLSVCYELSVYTNATADYADAVLAILDPDRKYFADRVAARKDRVSGEELKFLKRLYPDVDDRYVVAFDDRIDVWVDLRRTQLLRAEHYQFLALNYSNLMKYYPSGGDAVSSNFQIQEPIYDYDQHLLYMTDILLDAHKNFFAQLETNENVDIGQVLDNRKVSVLEGLGLCFTGFLKEEGKSEDILIAESERVHKSLARGFGAEIYSQFDEPGVTHVVALRSTTGNFKKCRESPCDRIKRVHALWLYDCIGTWQRSDESLFEADELCATLNQKTPLFPQHDHWSYRYSNTTPQKESTSPGAAAKRSSKQANADGSLVVRSFAGTGEYSNGSVVISPTERINIWWSPNNNTLGQNQNYVCYPVQYTRLNKQMEGRLGGSPPSSTALIPPPYISATSQERLNSANATSSHPLNITATLVDSVNFVTPHSTLYPSLAAAGITVSPVSGVCVNEQRTR